MPPWEWEPGAAFFLRLAFTCGGQRSSLLRLAAAQWLVPEAGCTARSNPGRIHHPNHSRRRSGSQGDLRPVQVVGPPSLRLEGSCRPSPSRNVVAASRPSAKPQALSGLRAYRVEAVVAQGNDEITIGRVGNMGKIVVFLSCQSSALSARSPAIGLNLGGSGVVSLRPAESQPSAKRPPTQPCF